MVVGVLEHFMGFQGMSGVFWVVLGLGGYMGILDDFRALQEVFLDDLVGLGACR